MLFLTSGHSGSWWCLSSRSDNSFEKRARAETTEQDLEEFVWFFETELRKKIVSREKYLFAVNVMLSYNIESESVSIKPSTHGEATEELLALLLVPHHAFLGTGVAGGVGGCQPCSPWSAVSSPHTHGLPHGEGTALPSRDWPSGNTFWALAGLQAWDEDRMLGVLPPVSATNCFYLISLISVTSAHTWACVWRWFGIVPSTKTEPGRGDPTWHDQTTLWKGRNNIRLWVMAPAGVYRWLNAEMTGLSQSPDGRVSGGRQDHFGGAHKCILAFILPRVFSGLIWDGLFHLLCSFITRHLWKTRFRKLF